MWFLILESRIEGDGEGVGVRGKRKGERVLAFGVVLNYNLT